MTSIDVTALQPLVANVITRRAGSAASAPAVAAAARRAYDDLAAVLVPIISQAGVDALVARALHLTKREYPVDLAEKEMSAEPFCLWLEQQNPAVVLGASTAILSTFAALLASLIGEPLTRRYLRKAWSDGVADSKPEGKRR